jgi:DNA-binding NarL/FixJ family response regulator
MPRDLRIFHCDDSAAFTRLVRHWLGEYEGIEHVGEAHDGEQALKMLPRAAPDVVLLDTMGSPGDTALLQRIRAAAPRARVIVYSGYLSILDSDELGGEADAYLQKGEDEHQLIAMINAVARLRE